MSSYRKFELDKAWDYHRVPSEPPNLLAFEQQINDVTRELVVLPGWPHMVRNPYLTGT
jgi:hypothetical protein